MSSVLYRFAEKNDIAGAKKYITEAEEKCIEELEKGDEEFFIIADPLHAVKPQATAPKRPYTSGYTGHKKATKSPNTTHLMWLMRLVIICIG